MRQAARYRPMEADDGPRRVSLYASSRGVVTKMCYMPCCFLVPPLEPGCHGLEAAVCGSTGIPYKSC